MKHYAISYSGDSTAYVEAESAEAATDKFWDDGLNDIDNAEIFNVEETKKPNPTPVVMAITPDGDHIVVARFKDYTAARQYLTKCYLATGYRS